MRRRMGQHLTHGPRRLVLRPWKRVCRCGLGAWPCYAYLMLRRQADMRKQANSRRPAWDGATTRIPVAPLLTRGQLARSRQARSW